MFPHQHLKKNNKAKKPPKKTHLVTSRKKIWRFSCASKRYKASWLMYSSETWCSFHICGINSSTSHQWLYNNYTKIMHAFFLLQFNHPVCLKSINASVEPRESFYLIKIFQSKIFQYICEFLRFSHVKTVWFIVSAPGRYKHR